MALGTEPRARTTAKARPAVIREKYSKGPKMRASFVSGAATPETRPVELVVFALVLTAACIGLFRFALGLPLPVLNIPGLVTI